MNVMLGHNERVVRLGLLADTARTALAQVASGEDDTLAGWLAYGAALNEGRGLFPSDEQFGKWIEETVSTNLVHTPRREDRAAAMWAAANAEQFEEARAAGAARTVRGIHAKWKELEAEREAEEQRRIAEAARKEAEARAEAEAKARAEAKAAADEKARKEAEARAEAEAEAKAKAEVERKTAQKKASAAAKRAKKSSDRTAAHVSNNSGDNEWYTPEAYVEAARRVMGGIDLDPASSEIANRTVRAAQFFTEETDGLAADWPVGRIWMNPPYAQPLISQFCEKFAAQLAGGGDAEGIVLVNNATETAWFQTLLSVSSCVCFPRGRIKFLDIDGTPSGAPLQGQALIYSGPNRRAFRDVFSEFGEVLSRG